MTVLSKRISLEAMLLFPTRSTEFDEFFKESNCRQGVCFAFSIFFLKGIPINPSDGLCRTSLIKLQNRHQKSVTSSHHYLEPHDLSRYDIRFIDRIDFSTRDLGAVTSHFQQWVTSNKDLPTKTIVSISATSSNGIEKHFLPLVFIPQKNKWEVGDTAFRLAGDHTVVRYEINRHDLEDYLNWQTSKVVRSHSFRKISIIQIA